MTGVPAAQKAPNCVDIIRPFIGEVEEEGLLDLIQVIGGVGSAALANPASEILPDEELIVAPSGMYLPSERIDGNKRDLDVLVLSEDPELIGKVEAIAEETVEDKLEISVFGLREAGYVRRQLRHPWRIKAFKTFSADRFVSDDQAMAEDILPLDIPEYGDDSDSVLAKVAFPFGVWMHPEAMASYRTLVGDLSVPTPHPAGAIMNYKTRSLSFARWKDHYAIEEGKEVEGKVPRMERNTFRQVPDFVDWIKSGPGATLLDLAVVFHSLQGPSDFRKAQPHVMGDGAIMIEPIPIRALMRHPAFMLRDRDPRQQENILAWARVKSMALRKAESYPEVVRLFQKYGEKLVDGIVKNK